VSRPNVVTGLRAVEQLLAAPGTEIRRIFAEYQTVNPRVEAIIRQARQRGIEVQAANRARLQQISGEARHQGVVAEVRRNSVLDEAGLRTLVEARLTSDDGRPLLLLILDGVQDPHNLGACLRSADAAGADAAVVPRHGAADLGPAVSKVAAGAAETLPFAAVPNLARVLDWLGEYGVRRIGTADSATVSLFDTDLGGDLGLIMGGEHGGVSRSTADRCDALIRLPMRGSVSSLNVSVAAGICLYEALRQRGASPSPGSR